MEEKTVDAILQQVSVGGGVYFYAQTAARNTPGSRFFMKHEGERLEIHWFCSGYGLAAGARGQIRRNFWDGTYQKQRSKRNVHNKHDGGGFKRCVMKYCQLTNDYFVLVPKGDDFF